MTLEPFAERGDAISRFLVRCATDVELVRTAAAACGRVPFISAKSERTGALTTLLELHAAANALMVARGDVGVELSVERTPTA